MRKRYQQGREVPVTYARDAYPLAMGDGTFVLVSHLEKLQGITPNEIRAQEAQEEAARPTGIAGQTFRGWKFDTAPVLISGLDLLKDTLAQTPEAAEGAQMDPEYLARNLDKKAIRGLLESIDKNSLPMPAAVDFGVDPERGSEVTWFCLSCMTGGSGKDQIAADAALNTHRDSPEHDRAVEKSLRCRLEAARTALYDYLKSKGRVA